MRGGESKAVWNFSKKSSNLVAGPFPNRHNHLGDSHIIGRLLKPHMTMTIFMNFAARHSLIKPKDSLTQQQFSVKSAIIHPYSLSFHKKIIVNSTDWAISSMLDWPSISTPTGGKIWRSEADLWWDVEQVLLAEHDLPKDDGRERIPWKPDRWVATVPLQVNVRFEQGLSGQRPLTVGGRWDPLWIVFVTGTMDLSCGTPCITMLTKLSSAIILVNK